MRRKIEWYQEVLALEPGSRIFFPLAKLFVEFGQLEDAERTLRQGLDRHPDSMEARLLLIQVLTRQERYDEALEHMPAVIKPLERYPAFWSLWAQQTAEKDRDFSVFLMLVASHFTDRPVKWTDVVIEGLSSLTERLIGPLKTGARKPREHTVSAPQAQPAPDRSAAALDGAEAGYDGPAPEAGSYRTRTMAELLASQGDFGGALGIYRELWGRALDDREKTDLSSRIATLEANMAAAPAGEGGPVPPPADDPFGKHAKNRLMSTLEALAARLESRIQA
ncbi:Tetratricopeptide repeat-containing protein [Humidesulfovibrio mexicanus]|uniref:Tetratricopeptide repeat-containing protein n=1 Tax=Humidesulfovibrio mexicanus TaxID=147047 RepID=A0A238XR70_9BACT|nr:tetratricopeptide repeat protein [Humidesulfovibrio mexicanus]SNR60953.1 Tetratricopeptide repeat-containing protein [Humidesulfovibrio mexicanus]